MKRPDVRLIQDQQIENNDSPNIDSWEAEQLLRKYGYSSANSPSERIPVPDPNADLTFEEMVALQQSREKAASAKIAQQSGPKPITFDGKNGYHTETRYGSDEDSGYGFKIQITSDMPIPPRY